MSTDPTMHSTVLATIRTATGSGTTRRVAACLISCALKAALHRQNSPADRSRRYAADC